MAAEKDSEYRKSELLNLFAQYVELPADIKIQHLKSLIEKDNFEILDDNDDQKKMASPDLFKKQLESLEKDVDKVKDHSRNICSHEKFLSDNCWPQKRKASSGSVRKN